MKNTVSEVGLITNKVVFLDGMARAGKFFLAKLVSSFENTEFFQFNAILEQLPMLSHTGVLNKVDAQRLMRIYLNMSVYERYIGRNLNLKISDSSALQNSHEFNHYINRANDKRDHALFDEILKENRFNPFIVHECVTFLEDFLLAFPKSYFINIQRHPLDLMTSWYNRGWGTRLGVDPLSFSPCFEIDSGAYPWFAQSWKKEYLQMTPLNRIAKSILVLVEGELDAMEGELFKRTSIDLCYERFFIDPHQNIKKIGDYLGAKPIESIDQILEREGCFKSTVALTLQRKESFLNFQKDLDKEILEKILLLATRYETKWNLNSFL